MPIDTIAILQENYRNANKELRNAFNEQDEAMEAVRKSYQERIKKSTDNRNAILVEMHNEIASVMRSDDLWFENPDLFKLVSDGILEEGTNPFFYDDDFTPVRDEIEKFFDHDLLAGYDSYQYRDGRSEYDHSCDHVAMPKVMIHASDTDKEIEDLAAHIEPYVDAARAYIATVSNKTASISVLEHTLSEDGIIRIFTPDKGKFKIVKITYGTMSDMTEEKDLVSVLKDVRDNYWY